MKISAIVSKCKESKRLVLAKEDGQIWLGDREVMYSVPLPDEITVGYIPEMYGIGKNDTEKMTIEQGSLGVYNVGVDEINETDIGILPMTISYKGRKLTPIMRESGIGFIDQSFFKIVEHDKSMTLKERTTPYNRGYLVAKTGLIVRAVINFIDVDNYFKEIINTISASL